MFEHAVDGVQQFAHDGGQGDHLRFALGAQMLIERAQVRLMANGHQSGCTAGLVFSPAGIFSYRRLRSTADKAVRNTQRTAKLKASLALPGGLTGQIGNAEVLESKKVVTPPDVGYLKKL
jgi:hypothetical protein